MRHSAMRPPRPPRSRLVTAAVAVLVAASLGAWSAMTVPGVAAGAVGGGTGTAAGANQIAAAAADDDAAEAAATLTGDISFNPPSRAFTGQISVSLSTDVAGAQIRYTTNGQLPTASSSLYTGAIQLTNTAQVRAQPFVNGAPAGDPGTAIYLASTVTTSHDLPVLVLDSYGQGKPGRDWMDTAVMQFDPVNGSTTVAGTPTIATRAGFHLHGQSSASFAKTPYRVELRDNQDDDLDWPLLGMPADSDWVLRGPFTDKSLIREAFVFDVGRAMGLQAPRYRFAEVYVDTDGQPVSASDYMGVYMVEETIKDSKNRLDLHQLDEDDTTLPTITGGYIMQFQWMAAEEPTLQCSGSDATCWHYLEVDDPDPLNSQQKAWLTQYIQQFNDMMNGPNFADPDTGYRSWIDVGSWVDQLIIYELSKNMDAYLRSAYFYKDRNDVIHAGPLWDYDLTFGVGGYFNNDQISGWQYQQTRQPIANDWFQRLMQDPAFVDDVRTRWSQLRQGILSDSAIQSRINALAAPLANAAQRNFQRWPNLTQAQIGPFFTPTDSTWQGQVDDMRNWVLQRAAWLDTSGGWLVSVPPTNPTTPASPTPTRTATTGPPTTAPTTGGPTTNPGGGGCSATYTLVNQWQGGFQGQVTVTAGSSAISGWRVSWTLGSGQSISQIWNATKSQSGSSVVATNMSYNGSLAAGASTTFGFLGSGSASGTPSLTCTAT